ncbi:MAG TPA: ABC transporter permease [Thermoanaerobaculia bacterium]|nr:ABC transporter permease [Thermoanaerobaculia bacterium]
MRRHLFLLRQLVRRDFQGRYAGSVLGFVWSFVQPLWLLVLFGFVFGTVMRISPLGERTEHFAVFLFCGLLPWMAFHEGAQRGATAITDNAPLVKKLSFPSEILVLAVALAALLHEAIALVVFMIMLIALGDLTVVSLPLLLLAVPLQLALTVGLALLLAAVNVFFRDTAQIVGLVFNGWFYLTPIVYPLALVPEAYRPLIALNPLTALVELYRQALLGGRLALPEGWITLVVFSAVVLFAGLWLFSRLKPAFVDEV